MSSRRSEGNFRRIPKMGIQHRVVLDGEGVEAYLVRSRKTLPPKHRYERQNSRVAARGISR